MINDNRRSIAGLIFRGLDLSIRAFHSTRWITTTVVTTPYCTPISTTASQGVQFIDGQQQPVTDRHLPERQSPHGRCSRESILVVQLRCTPKLTPSHAVSCPTCVNSQPQRDAHVYEALRADLGELFGVACRIQSTMIDGMIWTEEMPTLACFDEPTAAVNSSASTPSTTPTA